MKNPLDPRHIRRQKAVEDLFKYDFKKQPISNLSRIIIKSIDKINKEIEEAAPEFPLDKINRVDLAILKLAVFELAVEKKEPAKVIIDEAVELAKEYGGETSPSFVNGVLGKVLKKYDSKI
jgi:transcription antitermination protein NusB